mgnify:CR=1 FL=1
MSDDTPTPSAPSPSVGAIHPSPSEEEAVAIAAALEVGWPRLGGRPRRRGAVTLALLGALVVTADPRTPGPPLAVVTTQVVDGGSEMK